METRVPKLLAMARLLDLTSLSGNESDGSIQSMCSRASGVFGHVAALCVFPRFVPVARATLNALGLNSVRLATVANFPHGSVDPDQAVAEIKSCVGQGAQEIDLVFPYKAFLLGHHDGVRIFLDKCRSSCPVTLKIILETGELADTVLIREASRMVIEHGADFLKTSTGKTPVHATLEAARVMLETIAGSARHVGFKASGGLRRVDDAMPYLELAEGLMGPDWVGPQTFRFGASGLLDDVVRELTVAGDQCDESA